MEKYKVRIEKVESSERKTTEYQKIADSGNERDGKAVYGYVPVVKDIVEENKIFECEVETLDIQKVINAIYFQ